MSLEPFLSRLDPQGKIPPVDQWDPDYCGDMDLVIKADGRWIHEGAPIGRPRLLRLLSSVLRREADGDYYLVTPVEKLRITVEDRPFLIIDAECEHHQAGAEDVAVWWLVTNTADRVRLDGQHLLEVSHTPEGEPVPEVPVRFGLKARFNRNVYYRLVEAAEQRVINGRRELGLYSEGAWQLLGHLDEAPR